MTNVVLYIKRLLMSAAANCLRWLLLLLLRYLWDTSIIIYQLRVVCMLFCRVASNKHPNASWVNRRINDNSVRYDTYNLYHSISLKNWPVWWYRVQCIAVTVNLAERELPNASKVKKMKQSITVHKVKVSCKCSFLPWYLTVVFHRTVTLSGTLCILCSCEFVKLKKKLNFQWQFPSSFKSALLRDCLTQNSSVQCSVVSCWERTGMATEESTLISIQTQTQPAVGSFMLPLMFSGLRWFVDLVRMVHVGRRAMPVCVMTAISLICRWTWKLDSNSVALFA